MHKFSRDNLVAGKNRSKGYYDQKTEDVKFQEGDKVLLYDETVRRGRSRELSSEWIGPYEVVVVDKLMPALRGGINCKSAHK